jgi:hypothetical protein
MRGDILSLFYCFVLSKKQKTKKAALGFSPVSEMLAVTLS